MKFEVGNPRPTAVQDVSGTLKVGALNLLNYFNTFDGLPDNVDQIATTALGGLRQTVAVQILRPSLIVNGPRRWQLSLP